MKKALLLLLASVATPAVAQSCPGQYSDLSAPVALLDGQTPANPDATDNQPYELGTLVQAQTDGVITHLRFFRATSEPGSHIGRVWSADTGEELAQVEFYRESPAGWQIATLRTPVVLRAGQRVIISVNSNGYFPISPGAFAQPITRGGLIGLNGLFGPQGAAPSSSYNQSSYFVDAVFRAGTAAGTTQAGAGSELCVTNPTGAVELSSLFADLQPANPDATDNKPYELGTVVTPTSDGQVTQVRFYKAASETGAHIGRIWSATTGAQLAQVAFQNETASGWQVATLDTPLELRAGDRIVVSVNSNSHFPISVGGLSAPLARGYLATPSDGVPSLFGPPGALPTNSFENSNYFVDLVYRAESTLFGNREPTLSNASDNGASYELGLRFVPQRDGMITGFRYWNSPNDTGTHRATLWSSTGEQLLTTEFAAETGEGWKALRLATPFAVTAGQTYVLSVNANGFFPITYNVFNNDPVTSTWLAAPNDGQNGLYGDVGQFPTSTYAASNYFRDVIFRPGSTATPPAPISNAVTPTPTLPPSGSTEPWVVRGYLGWIRDLASRPSAADVRWPDISIDDELIADYDRAGDFLVKHGGTSIQIWGLAAGGTAGSPGYAVDVENTVSPQRRAQLRQIIDGLHAKGLKVVAGMGGMSWGFDQIVQANPSIRCSNSPYLANPRVELAWTYQNRIIDYLMSFGVDGITVQPADQGVCAEGNPNGQSEVQYHAAIVERIGAYIRSRYPNAIIGSANYGAGFGNGSDLPYVQQFARNVDYIVDVNDTALQSGSGYRQRLTAAIAPTLLGQQADPGPIAPVHFDRLSWFLPTFQRTINNLKRLYADGGRAAENFMRMLANPGDEVSVAMILQYERNPASDLNANLTAFLQETYAPVDAVALEELRTLFVDAENAYFNNAYSENSLVEAYYNFYDRGRPYLRDNMSAQGRANYRAALVSLIARAQALQGRVGNSAKVADIITCMRAVIAQIDELPR
ncbi:DUF4082 domain-containing protein [Erythrobacter colymbi]|uniref:DUF4082 domain-containing protein n=1 Tax=Erythrobacter colymbi TaxID=1161202 RepID=UPI000A38FA86|nr:DUF4082 domain-containing protein [Erythrobacter colymbi]